MMKYGFLLLAGALVVVAVGCGDDPTSGGGGAGPGGNASAGGHGGAGGGAETGGGGGHGGASPDPCVDDPTAAIPAMQLVPFVEGLERPIHMIPDPTKAGRYFVTERVGKVMIVDDGVVLPEPFLDVSSEVSCCDEDRGFFMIALHPSFADNGLFYVNYSHQGTPANSTTILAEYHRSDADPTKADPDALRTLIELPQTTVWHYGGTLAFGADGMLYYSRGDGGGEGDPENDAQNPQKELGKILRIDVDTFPEPPAGNLEGADPFVWSLGLRNPWRMSFDHCTGDLYIGDVGQNQFEEVSVDVGGTGHKNFGWHMYEGTTCYEPPCDSEGITMPVVTHAHNTGFCAVIGGYVYRGSALPELRGRYFYGDICSRAVYSFRLVDGAATDLIEHTYDIDSDVIIQEQGFGSFAEDENGELYLCDMEAGAIYRLEPAAG